MKREIPVLGLVLVLTLLLILPMFQLTTTHAFVCNISTVFSGVGGCYVYISMERPACYFCGRQHQYLITESGIVGSIKVFTSSHNTCYSSRWYICVYGYILESGDLASHYIKPFSYTGYCFYWPNYGSVVFYCLSTPPKSMFYLGDLHGIYYVSCFYLFRCLGFKVSGTSIIGTYVYTLGGEVMPSVIGFRVPLDDIFYYILSPSLFCGSVITKTRHISTLGSYLGDNWFRATRYWICCAYIAYIRSTVKWTLYGPYGCPYVNSYVCWCYKPLTVTTLTYTASIGTNKFTGRFCLINTFLTILPTKTMTCSMVLALHPCLCWYGSRTWTWFVIYTTSGFFCVYTSMVWWGWWWVTRTNYNWGTFTRITVYVDGGVLINYLPYGTEYMFYLRLCYPYS